MKKNVWKTVAAFGLAASLIPAANVLADDEVDLASFGSGDVAVEDETMQYRIFDPSANGYEAESYPLVVFLHGEDGVGTDNEAQLTANKGATLWAEDNQAKQNPSYVLAPQCEDEDWTSDENVALVKAAIDEVVAENDKVDTDRIYIQGMSMGGTGTWKMLMEYPDLFAGAIPICGQVPAEYYETPGSFEALKNMPIWAFHTADDDVIPVEETGKAVEALKNAGSNCIKYEEYSAGSISPAHTVWNRVYAIGTPYNWLMMQSRTRTEGNTVDPSMLFSKKVISDKITRVCDYELGEIYVLEDDTSTVIIDTGMGGGGEADLYAYLKENVFKNKETSFDILLTHNHGDHIKGIPTLLLSGKVNNIYIHEADNEGLVTTMTEMNADLGDKVVFVKGGDTLTFGDQTLDVFEVPGHTPGSIVFFYDDYIFTGDAMGSGDLFLKNEYVENYVPSIQKFVDEMHARGLEFEILPGHAENTTPFYNIYAEDILACAKGIVDGSVPQKMYTRRVGAYGSFGTGNILYDSEKVHVN